MTPEKDSSLVKNYSKTSLKLKIENKLSLQKESKLFSGKDNFLIGIFVPLEESDYGNTYIEAIKALLEVGFQVAICSPMNEKYKKIMELFHKEYPEQFVAVSHSDESERKTLAACDATLMLSEHDALLKRALTYGVVPVTTEEKQLEDFNAVEEKGNAFIIPALTLWHVFEGCIRARENFKFPYDWKNLQVSCMETIN